MSSVTGCTCTVLFTGHMYVYYSCCVSNIMCVGADAAVGGSELQIDVKLIGPEGKLHLQLQQQQKKQKNKVTYLSVIGPDSHFITRRTMCLPPLCLSAGGSLRRQMKTSFLYGSLPADDTSEVSLFYLHVTLILITLQSAQLTSNPACFISSAKISH